MTLSGVFQAIVTLSAWIAGAIGFIGIIGLITEARKNGFITSSSGEPYSWPSLIALLALLASLVVFFLSEATKP